MFWFCCRDLLMYWYRALVSTDRLWVRAEFCGGHLNQADREFSAFD